MENAKGKGLLKVVGILLIIWGAIRVVIGLIAFVGIAAAGTLANSGALDAADAALLSEEAVIIGAISVLICGVLELITGIIGVINAKKPEKAMICIIFGVIIIICNIISSILDFSLLGLIMVLVLPVLFLIGGILNKKSVTAEF